jgi:ribonuclease HII
MMSFIDIENTFRKRGFEIIAGIDEVGRGALAGPLVAGVVILPTRIRLPKLNDSKLLSKKVRENLSAIIIEKAVSWVVGEVSAKEIDKIGVARANYLAFERALENLQVKPDFVLADYFNFDNLPYPTKGILGGDKIVRTIAAASVVAKVYRDNLMKKYHEEFSEYGFDKHVGYGTIKHREAIAKYGPCKLHRTSFRLT